MPTGAPNERRATARRSILKNFTNTVRKSIDWFLIANGAADPDFVAIGNPELIGKRTHRTVPLPPGGTLADYVPFYFTPKAPMLLNIKTGHNGIKQRPDQDIVILISSCRAMRDCGVAMLFTDRHAYTATAAWTARADDLSGMIDWDILCRHDFARDDRYPDKMERYQAEALAHRHVPVRALLGIGCASDVVKSSIEGQMRAAGLALEAFVRPGWYF